MKPSEQSRFTEYFVRANGLSEVDFDGWLLSTGMLFKSTHRWWGTQEKRKEPHEGLDLVFYRDSQNRAIGIDQSTRIPTMYAGVVVGVFDDLIGKSVFIRHDISDVERGRLCTIFGHTEPDSDIRPGKSLREGEAIARVAGVGASTVSPHLHITIGWAQEEITDDLLDWRVIGNTGVIKLIDPISFIGRYSLVPVSELFPR